MGLIRNPSKKRLAQPGLADPRLARQQQDLPLAGRRRPPAVEHQRQLGVAADQVRAAGIARRLEPGQRGMDARDLPSRYRLADPLQHLRGHWFEGEPVTHQPPRAGAHHHAVSGCDSLQPGREVGRLAQHRLLRGRADRRRIADHHHAGGDANPTGKFKVTDRTQPRHRRGDVEPGADRALGIVLVRLRIAKITSTPSPRNFATKPS